MSPRLLSWCLWMEAKDVTKVFPSVVQYCHIQRDSISFLTDVIVGNDMTELDAKSCSQMLTVETVKVMFIIHC